MITRIDIVFGVYFGNFLYWAAKFVIEAIAAAEARKAPAASG